MKGTTLAKEGTTSGVIPEGTGPSSGEALEGPVTPSGVALEGPVPSSGVTCGTLCPIKGVWREISGGLDQGSEGHPRNLTLSRQRTISSQVTASISGNRTEH